MSGSTSDLRAQFTLSLEDKLSAGLDKLLAKFDRLKALAGRLGMEKLAEAGAGIERTTGKIGQLDSKLQAVAGAASRATQAIRETTFAAAAGIKLPQIDAGAFGRSLQTAIEAEAPAASRSLWNRIASGAGGASRRIREGFGRFNEHVGLMGGAIAGIGLEKPIRDAAELDRTLTSIAVTKGMSGAAAFAEVTRLRSFLTADSVASGQSVASLADAYQDLTRRGLSSDLVERLLPTHSRAATTYGIEAGPLGAVVGSLASVDGGLGITDEGQVGRSIAALAYATHKGTFGMNDASRYLPSLAGAYKSIGMTGPDAANRMFADLETVTKGAADPSQAAINYTDMIQYMGSSFAAKLFKKQGIDLRKVYSDAAAAGQSPIDAFLGIIEKQTAGISDPMLKKMEAQKYLHNMQAGSGTMSLIQNQAYRQKLLDELREVGADKLGRDHDTVMARLGPQLMMRDAKIKALELRMGDGFSWTVPVESGMLGGVLVAMKWLDVHLPGVTTVLLGVLGGMLGLVSVTGLLGVAIGPVTAGFGLLAPLLRFVLNPLGLLRSLLWTLLTPLVGIAGALGLPVILVEALALAFVGAALLIYLHWDRFRQFFTDLWMGVMEAFGGAWEFIAGLLTGNWPRAVAGLQQLWSGLGAMAAAAWDIVKGVFLEFLTWVDGWTGGLGTKLASGITAAFGVVGGIIEQSIAGWTKALNDLLSLFDRFRGGQVNDPTAPAGAPAVRGSQVDVDGARGFGIGGGASRDAATGPGMERNNLYLRGGRVFGGIGEAAGAPIQQAIVLQADMTRAMATAVQQIAAALNQRQPIQVTVTAPPGFGVDVGGRRDRDGQRLPDLGQAMGRP